MVCHLQIIHHHYPPNLNQKVHHRHFSFPLALLAAPLHLHFVLCHYLHHQTIRHHHRHHHHQRTYLQKHFFYVFSLSFSLFFSLYFYYYHLLNRQIVIPRLHLIHHPHLHQINRNTHLPFYLSFSCLSYLYYYYYYHHH